MSSNAAKLYERIKQDPSLTQSLFQKALQDPQGALEEICALGEKFSLPVKADEVKTYLANIDDPDTKQWLIKARGGL